VKIQYDMAVVHYHRNLNDCVCLNNFDTDVWISRTSPSFVRSHANVLLFDLKKIMYGSWLLLKWDLTYDAFT
jgi:hypothetical protein